MCDIDHRWPWWLRRLRPSAFVLALSLGLAACSTMRAVDALRHVDFELDRVSGVRVAGMPIEDVRSADDLTTAQGARLAAAFLGGGLPVDCGVIVRATNPASEPVAADLLRMKWTLLLDGRKAAAGVLDRRYTIPPGETVEIPVHVALDVADLLHRHGQSLIHLALALAGERSHPVEVSLRVVPYID